ncbi:hypothetical protein HDU96_003541, partial [Phlyctochytrium bullatum]
FTKYRLEMNNAMFISEFIHHHNLDVLYFMSAETLELPTEIQIKTSPQSSYNLGKLYAIHKLVTVRGKARRQHVYVLHRGSVSLRSHIPCMFYLDRDGRLVVRGLTELPHIVIDPQSPPLNDSKLWSSPTAPVLVPSPAPAEATTLPVTVEEVPLALDDFADSSDENSDLGVDESPHAVEAPPPPLRRSSRLKANHSDSPVEADADINPVPNNVSSPPVRRRRRSVPKDVPVDVPDLLSFDPRPAEASTKELLELAKQPYVARVPIDDPDAASAQSSDDFASEVAAWKELRVYQRRPAFKVAPDINVELIRRADPDSMDEDPSDPEYIIERLDRHHLNVDEKLYYYHVKWLGYGTAHNLWLAEHSVPVHVIQDYWERLQFIDCSAYRARAAFLKKHSSYLSRCAASRKR